MDSLFWFDYETFGANPQKDRPSQFAGIRTDTDLTIVGEPITLFCKPAPDFLPNPDACLITGITPQAAMREGLVECDFIQQIVDEMMVPGTCNVGYNNIRFDDEVTRNTLYRNFFDPYEHEWKNGNSRWDLIDVVRLTYALRPEGIEWPLDENGNPSFRLERLTAANNIEHEAAHDAMSDVYATIGVARLLKSKQPQLYDYAFGHRQKAQISALLNVVSHKPVFHVSSKYPASNGCCALVAPICEHPKNKNGVIVFDLRQNPDILLDLSVDEIRRRLYTRASDLQDSEVRPQLKTIHINKSPMVCPASMITTIAEEKRDQWELDIPGMQKNLEKLRKMPDLVSKVIQIFDDSIEDGPADPDLMIYKGGFFSFNDKAQMKKVRQTSGPDLDIDSFSFDDARLPEMLFRYKARNYPDALNENEHDQWHALCHERLFSPDSPFLTVEQFSKRLQELANDSSLNSDQRFILGELQLYAESIIPIE